VDRVAGTGYPGPRRCFASFPGDRQRTLTDVSETFATTDEECADGSEVLHGRRNAPRE
jgi:hypothetical protein